MIADILIVSVAKDVTWLDCCLRSIDKFVSGFRQIIVVVPGRDANWFTRFHGKRRVTVRHFDEVDGKGMLHSDVIRMSGDIWCPGSDVVLSLDSDCLFVKPVDPSYYLHGGKPRWYYEPYERMIRDSAFPHASRHGDKWIAHRHQWKRWTADALGFEPEVATQCAQPQMYWTWIYKQVRDHLTKRHGDFQRYVLSGPNAFPQQFNEVETMGAFSWRFHRNSYHWIDSASRAIAYGSEELHQFWSHGGFRMPAPEGDLIAGKPPLEIVLNTLCGAF